MAWVDGVASAAAFQVVAVCELAVAAVAARFAAPGVNIGLFCSTPMVALSRNVSRKHAMEMLLTGDLIPAGRAAEFGLVNRVVPEADLDDAALGFARQIASKRSEEHTSELQSLMRISYAVFCLKKKNPQHT